MKAILLLASLGLAVLVGPYAVREFYDRYIAIDRFGMPIDQWRCPACGNGARLQAAADARHHTCARCGHRWAVQPTPGFELFGD